MSKRTGEMLVNCPIRGIHLQLLVQRGLQSKDCNSTERKAIKELKEWGLLQGRGNYTSPHAGFLSSIISQRPTILQELQSKFALPLLNGLRGTHEHVVCSETTYRKIRHQFHKSGLVQRNPWRVIPWLQPLVDWYVKINQGADFLVYTCGQEMAWRAAGQKTALHGPEIRVQTQRELTNDELLLLQMRADRRAPPGTWIPLSPRVKPLLTSQAPFQHYEVREMEAAP